MKRAMVYILALSMLFSALLTGCGENKTDRPNATKTPEATILPESMMPDPEDGVVNDDDGIITDGDNGPIREGDGQIVAGPNDMEGNVSADPDVNAAVENDQAAKNGKMMNGSTAVQP